jgi:hypothetical protein
LADVESGSQPFQERPQFGRFESDIQRRRYNSYSEAGEISNDKLRQVCHMQSDAITFPKSTLDQPMRQAFDFSSQSLVCPDFLACGKSNLLSACC